MLLNGGLEVIMECALFYCSRMIQRVGSEKYELRDVIGPDEYHERIDNDGYTNRMAKYVLEHAVELADKYPGELRKMKYMDAEKLLRIKQAASRIYVPKPDEETGLIEQFDGYFSLEDVSVEEVRSRLLHPKEYWGGSNGVASHTQVIKQADIVMWLAMFPEDFSLEIIRANWNYYEPRTEHGSSLSACMYALTSCRMGDAETAYPLFLKSAMADLTGGGKEWAGNIYIGGTHPAAAGGAYLNVVMGFAGVRFSEEGIQCKPCLPKQWEELDFSVCYRKRRYHIHIAENKAEVRITE